MDLDNDNEGYTNLNPKIKKNKTLSDYLLILRDR
mgnify:FL=1